MPKCFSLFIFYFLIGFLFQLQSAGAVAPAAETAMIPSCDPVSEFLENLEEGRDPAFCAEWNPEFAYHGYRCCLKKSAKTRRIASRCAPKRRKWSYCDEMTPAQKQYIEEVSAGASHDFLFQLGQALGRRGSQAYCDVTDGFLAWGRPLVATPLNRILLRAPQKCTYFGTDEMIGLLEWLGREIGKVYSAPEFAGTRLLVGDLSAPRGGCLSGRGGRRGHRSHTSGLDVDLGFFSVKKGGASDAIPGSFSRQFDAKTNWWLLKKVFSNPYVCIQAIFLDRRLIHALSKVASKDPEWLEYRKVIRHVRGHRNHFHIRIGSHLGAAGCKVEEEILLEEEEEIEADDEAQLYPELNSEPTRGSAPDMHP